jgi:hypothetical protein
VSIKREIGDQPFQLGVFFPHLPQLPQLAQPEPRVFALPRIKRLFGNPYLPTDLRHGRAAFRLTQGGEHLFLGMSTSSCHRRALLPGKEDHVAGCFLKRLLA